MHTASKIKRNYNTMREDYWKNLNDEIIDEYCKTWENDVILFLNSFKNHHGQLRE